MYFDMYLYVINELDYRDSVLANGYRDKLHPQVTKDIDEYRSFLRKYRNRVEPIISSVYNSYLQANDQPEGKRTYNMVVSYLIAYYKKFGKEAL